MLKLIFKLGAVLTLVIALVAVWFMQDYQTFTESPIISTEMKTQVYTIPKGSNLYSIANDFKRKGWLEHPRYLVWHGRELGLSNKIQAGEYALQPGSTARDLLEQWAKGDVIQHSLTLVPGLNWKETLSSVQNNDVLVQTMDKVESAEHLADMVGFKGEHAEGRFLPDTYHFPRGMTDKQFLRRAWLAMDKALAEAWAKREKGLPLKTAYEALILASIIEKETGLASERPEIAGVFVRRLNKRMRLQTDPTVIYGMGDAFDGNIRRKDLRRDTPYNTYTRHGLTPTPIAMPSLDAIHAALHPKDGDTLYFVAKGQDGSHYFSKTLKEHNRAVRRYQLNRK